MLYWQSKPDQMKTLGSAELSIKNDFFEIYLFSYFPKLQSVFSLKVTL